MLMTVESSEIPLVGFQCIISKPHITQTYIHLLQQMRK